MLSQAEIAAAAQTPRPGRAHPACRSGCCRIAHPEMTLDDAYAVQAAFVALRHAQGRQTIGWKIGLTSKAMQ